MAEYSDDVQAPKLAETPDLPPVPPHVGRDLVLYILARFALVAAVAVILAAVNVPWLISIAVGIVAGLPLSMVLMRGWHARVAAGLAARGMHRRAARESLRAELRGESASDTSSTDLA